MEGESKQCLSASLHRRLSQAAGDSNDLLRRFADASDGVPLAALLLDRRFRRLAASGAAATAVSSKALFAALVAAAREAEGVTVAQSPCTVVRLESTAATAVHDEAATVPPPRCGEAGVPAASSAVAAPAAAEMPATEVAAVSAKAEAEATKASAPAVAEHTAVVVPAGSRNVKGELQGLLCRRLGRPVSKADMVFTVEATDEQPPMFAATAVVLGDHYRGAPETQKKRAEQSAALVALEALTGRGDDGTAPESTHAVFDSTEVVGEGSPAVDYKGQLVAWLRARGLDGSLRYEVERADPEEKVFQARAILDALGGRAVVGAPQPRRAHESSAKARRAAEQDAARSLLSELASQEPGTGLCASRTVQALRLAPEAHVLPSVEYVVISADDFLLAAAGVLHCSDVFPHPLQWDGDRPRGLCLYEAAEGLSGDEAELLSNIRGTILVGTPVAGAALLMHASAHTRGAVLQDVTGARYEALKAERSGELRFPAVALNVSRAMRIGGHPELPAEYLAKVWQGQNPRTLLQEVLCRQSGGAPRFQACAENAKEGSFVFAVELGDADSGRRFVGSARQSKADAQQDAALVALRGLGNEGEGLDAASDTRGEHPLASVGLRSLSAMHGGDVVVGTALVLSYKIFLKSRCQHSQDDAHPLVLEECRALRTVVGARVLHPALESLASVAPVMQRVELQVDGSYESATCQICLEIEVSERTLPNDSASLTAPSGRAQGRAVFDPPLRQQRLDFVASILLEQRVESAVDLGCGDGHLLESLLSRGMTRVVGVDHSEGRAVAARRRLEAACHAGQTAQVLIADLLEPDARWTGLDAAVSIEVLEHLTEADLKRFAGAVLGARPRIAVISTPNADFEICFDQDHDHARGKSASRGAVRHPDHEREWTRAEFRDWATAAAAEHGYALAAPDGVGVLPGLQEHGPCTQIAVFFRDGASACAGLLVGARADASTAVTLGDRGGETAQPKAAAVNFQEMSVTALREETLATAAAGIAGSAALRKLVTREGVGEVPPCHARVTLHHATYLADGQRIFSSREGKHAQATAFQLGGGKVVEAWHCAVATMRRGEVAWVSSPPEFAYGDLGCPPLIPAGEIIWFELEVVDFRLPGTLHTFKDLFKALEEAERHMELGRADLRRSACGQARQAFRRALDAVPAKLLLGHGELAAAPEVARFASLERSSLLNQALCSQRLAEAASEEATQAAPHWEDAVRVSSLLLERHLAATDDAASYDAAEGTETMAALAAAVRSASASAGTATWAAKAYFRRGLARAQLHYLTDAVADLEAAHRIAPTDAEVAARLSALRRRQQQVELEPSKMFAGIFERERDEREREAAEAVLTDKRRRREARLRGQAVG